MTKHVSNALYGVFDYAAYPAIMLMATPAMLRHLGVAAYGVWLVANAAIGAGSIVSSGFGDAVIQRIAALRSTRKSNAIRSVVANMLAINLVLSGVLASLLFMLVPLAAARISQQDPVLQTSCLWSLRIGSLLIVIKSVESVFISAQRAFEEYARAVQIGVATRLLTIAAAVALAYRGDGVAAIMAATAVIAAGGMAAQWAALRGLGIEVLRPAFDREVLRDLASFGAFSWMQAISGVFFSQADRLVLGVAIGASAVSYYGVCVQMAQPIHGLTAAGLHFLFPYLSREYARGDASAMRRPILLALSLNVLSAVGLSAMLLIFGNAILRHWMGQAFANFAPSLLPLLAIAFGLLALNVTGHYALLALGRVRLVTAFNVEGGVAMLAAMFLLVPRYGVSGAAAARLCFGPVTCLLYLPLLRILFEKPLEASRFARIAVEEA